MTFREQLLPYFGHKVAITGTVKHIVYRKQTMITLLKDIVVDGEVVVDHMWIKRQHFVPKGGKLKFTSEINYYETTEGEINLGFN